MRKSEFTDLVNRLKHDDDFLRGIINFVNDKLASGSQNEIPLYDMIWFGKRKKGLFSTLRDRFGLTRRQAVLMVLHILNQSKVSYWAYPSYSGFRFHEYIKYMVDENRHIYSWAKPLFKTGMWAVPCTHIVLSFKLKGCNNG